mgnify:CR=1 FL=1
MVRSHAAGVRGRGHESRCGSVDHCLLIGGNIERQAVCPEPFRRFVGQQVATSAARARSSWSRQGFMGLASRFISFRGGGGHLPIAWWPCMALTIESQARWVSSASDACIRSASLLGRSAGFWTLAREETLRGFQSDPVATSARIPENLFVAADIPTGIGTRRGHTLNAK